MAALDVAEGSSFSPSGILRIADVSENPLSASIRILETIRA
jgi:hypothetical protein